MTSARQALRSKGCALVVEGYFDVIALAGVGIAETVAPMVERYTPVGPNHLHYEATITDPETFTKPWKMSMPLYRRQDRNAQLLEFKCVEFSEELLYGDLVKKPE